MAGILCYICQLEFANKKCLCKWMQKKLKLRSSLNFICSFKGTHNADSIIESKVIYYLEQCGLRV